MSIYASVKRGGQYVFLVCHHGSIHPLPKCFSPPKMSKHSKNKGNTIPELCLSRTFTCAEPSLITEGFLLSFFLNIYLIKQQCNHLFLINISVKHVK